MHECVTQQQKPAASIAIYWPQLTVVITWSPWRDHRHLHQSPSPVVKECYHRSNLEWKNGVVN